MPLAPSRRTNQIQSAAVKPWLNPYQGTTVTAAAKVTANMAVVIQFRGIDSAGASLKATGLMGTRLSPGDQPFLLLETGKHACQREIYHSYGEDCSAAISPGRRLISCPPI